MTSLACAYVISLLVEWPMIGILRVMFPNARRTPKKVEMKEEEVDSETGSDPPSYSSWKQVTIGYGNTRNARCYGLMNLSRPKNNVHGLKRRCF